MLKHQVETMLSNILVLHHLVLAFAVGSIWVTFVTRVAEKFGSSIGGVLGVAPSASALSFFFIGLNQSASVAVQTTTAFPLAAAIESWICMKKQGINKKVRLPKECHQDQPIHPCGSTEFCPHDAETFIFFREGLR